jgi:hypothetical protein
MSWPAAVAATAAAAAAVPKNSRLVVFIPEFLLVLKIQSTQFRVDINVHPVLYNMVRLPITRIPTSTRGCSVFVSYRTRPTIQPEIAEWITASFSAAALSLSKSANRDVEDCCLFILNASTKYILGVPVRPARRAVGSSRNCVTREFGEKRRASFEDSPEGE